MKKICIIQGSYRKNGNTAMLTKHFIKGFKKTNPKSKIIIHNLTEENIKFSKGYNKHNKNDGKKIGNCTIKDNMHKILEDMLNSDAIVLTSPIYYSGVTAIMKRFIERTILLNVCIDKFPKNRNKILKNKKGLIILTSACPNFLNWILGITKHPKYVLKTVLKSAQCGKIKKLIIGGTSPIKKINKKYLNKAYKIGLEF